MSNQPIVLEREVNASPETVWDALTNNSKLQKWYFKLPEFRAEVGFEFEFPGGADDELPYRHLCKISEVVPDKKISYTWRYDGYPGNSLVTFELVPVGDKKTRIILTHSGLETLESSGPDFARNNFEVGWTSILNTSLSGFLEGQRA